MNFEKWMNCNWLQRDVLWMNFIIRQYRYFIVCLLGWWLSSYVLFMGRHRANTTLQIMLIILNDVMTGAAIQSFCVALIFRMLRGFCFMHINLHKYFGIFRWASWRYFQSSYSILEFFYAMPGILELRYAVFDVWRIELEDGLVDKRISMFISSAVALIQFTKCIYDLNRPFAIYYSPQSWADQFLQRFYWCWSSNLSLQ